MGQRGQVGQTRNIRAGDGRAAFAHAVARLALPLGEHPGLVAIATQPVFMPPKRADAVDDVERRRVEIERRGAIKPAQRRVAMRIRLHPRRTPPCHLPSVYGIEHELQLERWDGPTKPQAR